MRRALRGLASRRQARKGRALGAALAYASSLLRLYKVEKSASRVIILTSGVGNVGGGAVPDTWADDSADSAAVVKDVEEVAALCDALWDDHRVAMDVILTENRDSVRPRPFLEKFVRACSGRVYSIEAQDVAKTADFDPATDFAATLQATLESIVTAEKAAPQLCSGAEIDIRTSQGIKLVRIIGSVEFRAEDRAASAEDALDTVWSHQVQKLRARRYSTTDTLSLVLAADPALDAPKDDPSFFVQVTVKVYAPGAADAESKGGRTSASATAAYRVWSRRWDRTESFLELLGDIDDQAMLALQAKLAVCDLRLESSRPVNVEKKSSKWKLPFLKPLRRSKRATTLQLFEADDAWKEGSRVGLLRPDRQAMADGRQHLDECSAWVLLRLVELDSSLSAHAGEDEEPFSSEELLKRYMESLRRYTMNLFQLRQGPLLTALQSNVDSLLDQRSFLKTSSIEQTILAVTGLLFALDQSAEDRFLRCRPELIAFQQDRVLIYHARDVIFVWIGDKVIQRAESSKEAFAFAETRQRACPTAPPPSIYLLSGSSNLARHLAGRMVPSFDLSGDEVEKRRGELPESIASYLGNSCLSYVDYLEQLRCRHSSWSTWRKRK